jgi:hypothetical protein
MGVYASVVSVLAGPHGDSGFGADQASSEARARRVAPVPVEPAAPQAEVRRERRRFRLPWRR